MQLFPARNRRHNNLDWLEIVVEDIVALRRFTPNEIVHWNMQGGPSRLIPFDLAGDIHSRPSEASGIVFYRSHDIELRLTVKQLERLINLNLRPLEYFQLRELFGLFHEIHEDFYDPESGAALQPRILK